MKTFFYAMILGLSCSASAYAADDAGLIIRSSGIEGYQIGSSRAQVESGPYQLTYADQPPNVSRSDCSLARVKLAALDDVPREIYFLFEGEQLARIYMERGRYHTPENLALGSHEDEVRAIYGKDITIRPHPIYDRGHTMFTENHGLGILFETNQNHVVGISVGTPRALMRKDACARPKKD